MDGIAKSVSDKISSYNLFNNLLPGTIFCSVLTQTTRFNFSANNIIEQLFIWYFVGMIISRIGSIFVESGLKKLKVKNEPYLVFADYKQYAAASKANPYIAALSEINNTYRTIIALIISLSFVYLYDNVLYDWLAEKCVLCNKLIVVLVGLFLIILFVMSYKKQTEYIKKHVEKYVSEQGLSK